MPFDDMSAVKTKMSDTSLRLWLAFSPALAAPAGLALVQAPRDGPLTVSELWRQAS